MAFNFESVLGTMVFIFLPYICVLVSLSLVTDMEYCSIYPWFRGQLNICVGGLLLSLSVFKFVGYVVFGYSCVVTQVNMLY